MWEKKQPRPLGNYTVEQHGGSGIKGIINQAKKQARRSYIYYLHFFHFRRCNQQIYGGRLLCVTGTGRLCTHFDHWPSKCKVGSVLLTALVFLFFFPSRRLLSPHNAPCLQSNLHNKQSKSQNHVVVSLPFKLGCLQNWVHTSQPSVELFCIMQCLHLTWWERNSYFKVMWQKYHRIDQRGTWGSDQSKGRPRENWHVYKKWTKARQLKVNPSCRRSFDGNSVWIS